MKEITYPQSLSTLGPIFLGGSTSKGDWQKEVIEYMSDTTAVFVNTCRPDWDIAEPSREAKNDHIDWEFDWLYRTPINFICVPADAKSPTVMLELGIAITKAKYLGTPLVVYIDMAYSHFNNARIACRAAQVPVYSDFQSAKKRLKDLFLTSSRF